MLWPIRNSGAAVARNSATSAISSGVPRRPPVWSKYPSSQISEKNSDAIAANADCRPEHTQVRGKGDEESLKPHSKRTSVRGVGASVFEHKDPYGFQNCRYEFDDRFWRQTDCDWLDRFLKFGLVCLRTISKELACRPALPVIASLYILHVSTFFDGLQYENRGSIQVGQFTSGAITQGLPVRRSRGRNISPR